MEKNKKHFYENKSFWIYFVIFLVSVLFLFLAHDSHINAAAPSIAHLMKELGFAGVVAVILVITVESFTRRRHEEAADELMDRINHNLFYAVYKRFIPEEVFSEVEKCIMNSKVMRRRHQLTYTLDEFPEGAKDVDRSKYFLCKAQTRYQLHNLTDSDIKHDVVILLEEPLDPSLKNYCKVVSVQVGDLKLADEVIAAASHSSSKELSFRHQITIPAKGKVQVHTASELIKCKTDMEIWASRVPSDGLQLTVNTPSKNIEVHAKANHYEPIEKSPQDSPTSQTWELDKGIIPYQSIVFWWKQNDTQKTTNSHIEH